MGTAPFMLLPALQACVACFACAESQCQDAGCAAGDECVCRVSLQASAFLALGTAGLITGMQFAVTKESMVFEKKGKHHIELG